MTRKHIVKPGDSVLQLAFEEGFGAWKDVWDHPDNAAIRERRKDPQVLLEGDELALPSRDVELKERCPVNKLHRFRLTRPRAWLNLRWQDDEGEPLAETRFMLVLEGRRYDGTTDAHGVLSVEIQPTDRHGRVTLWLEDPHEVFEAPVWVGHLDPASSVTGARDRLRNLGMQCGRDSGGELDASPTTRDALAALQMSFGHDAAEGELDDETAALLEHFHDSN